MRKELVQMFAATNLLSDPEQDFVLVQMPPSAYRQLLSLLAARDDAGFETVVRTHDEVTLVATVALWDQLQDRLPATNVDGPWRLITLDVTIPLEVYGYLEQVARICGEQGASIVVESGFSTDHIFVKASLYREVLASLDEFIRRCREEVHSV